MAMHFNVDYPERSDKIMVLLGSGGDASSFKEAYLHKHSKKILSIPQVERYTASLVVSDDAKLNEAVSRTGSAGNCPWPVAAVDSVYGASWAELAQAYRDCDVIAAFRTTEYLVRPFHPDYPLGTKRPQPERIGMLVRPEGISDEDARRHWIEIHGSKCLAHHTGLAEYSQSHIEECLLDTGRELLGINSLAYWSLDAIRFGHFSKPESQDVILEDCSHFRSATYTLMAETYPFK